MAPRTVRFGSLFAVALGLAVLLGGCAPGANRDAGKEEATDAVTLQVVSLEEFQQAVRGAKGKVVVLDVWADWCIPCKEKFPSFLKLAEKFQGDKDVEFWSLSLDRAKDKDKALKFLREKNAALTNYLLDVDAEKAWQDHFDMYGPPAVFVYDAAGARAGSFVVDPLAERQYTYDDVEKLVRKLSES